MKQEIFWTNAYTIHWLIYVGLGGDELKDWLNVRGMSKIKCTIR